jgi:hypothetical protein
MLTVGLNLKPRVKKGFDSDAQAFFTRVTVAGGTLSATEKLATNQLVLDMKSAGIWTSMKAIYPMVGASAAACAQNLKSSSFTGSFTSGWTFASTGVTPNGTSAYMDTALNASTQLTQNNASFSIYNRTNSDGTRCDIGCTDSIAAARLITIYSRQTNVINADINSTASRISVANTNSIGFYLTRRTANNIFKLNKNSVNIGNNTTTDNTVMPNFNIYLGGIPFFSQFSNREYAFSSIGDGLTDLQASDFYTNVQTFNTTLSRQV